MKHLFFVRRLSRTLLSVDFPKGVRFLDLISVTRDGTVNILSITHISSEYPALVQLETIIAQVIRMVYTYRNG